MWINNKTRVLVQGITGEQGRYHTQQMLSDGTQIVAGVTPGKGGESVQGVPVFNTVGEAQSALGAKAAEWAIGFVPPAHAKSAALEALNTGLNIVVITEHVPVHDTLKVLQVAQEKNLHAIGPNCPGIIKPGQIKIGIMPASVFKPGRIGVVSRSGTLTYEVVSHLSGAGLGQSTCIGIGGDPIQLTSLSGALIGLQEDTATQAIVLIGEIGGSAEEQIAEELIGSTITKPVVAFLAGRNAPHGTTLGHAGAI
ncbi:MAG: CoA-binding protein, partial [bacterium]|nr:CoA-binding protein [bacterium]